MSLKKMLLYSLLWKFLERTCNQGVLFIVQIFLARLLVPEDFGMIAILMVFVNIAQVFVQNGFNTALIQAKNVDDLDYSSVFYLSLTVAGVLYTIIYVKAYLIANFYELPQLVPILRVLSLLLFFGAVSSIQNAVVSKDFKFKQLFYSSFWAIILSGTIGITLAYGGYGIWSLVWQQLLNAFFLCIIMWFSVKWRPCLKFSLLRLSKLFSFGWKLLVSALLDTGYRQTQSLVIGKMFSLSDLGYYSRGELFPSVVVNNIDGSIQAVMLPTLSQMQDDPIKIKELMRKAITMSTYIIAPLMAGMIATADPLVMLVLTEKWLPSIPFIRICCISFSLYPIHTANLQAINAIGRSDIFLKLEIIKKIIGVIVLLITIVCFGSMMAIAWSAVISGVISSFLNAYPSKKLINYSYFEQIKDIIPAMILSFVMGGIVYCIIYLGLGNFVTLVLQITLGVAIYSFLSWLFNIESFFSILKLLNRGKFN